MHSISQTVHIFRYIGSNIRDLDIWKSSTLARFQILPLWAYQVWAEFKQFSKLFFSKVQKYIFMPKLFVISRPKSLKNLSTLIWQIEIPSSWHLLTIWSDLQNGHFTGEKLHKRAPVRNKEQMATLRHETKFTSSLLFKLLWFFTQIIYCYKMFSASASTDVQVSTNWLLVWSRWL